MKASYFYKTETVNGVLIVTVRSRFFDSIPVDGDVPFVHALIADFRERMESVEQPLVIDLTELGRLNHFLLSTLYQMFKHRPETIHRLAFYGPAYLPDFWNGREKHLGGPCFDSLPKAIDAVLPD